jgi:hypothetical protein
MWLETLITKTLDKDIFCISFLLGHSRRPVEQAFCVVGMHQNVEAIISPIHMERNKSAGSLVRCVKRVSRTGRWTQALNNTWLASFQATWPDCVSFYLSLFFDQRYNCAGRVTRCDRAKSWRQGLAARK